MLRTRYKNWTNDVRRSALVETVRKQTPAFMPTDDRPDAPIPVESAIVGCERTGKRTALITGAAGGIGLELTRLLAADGYNLVIVGRDRERLEGVEADLRTQHQVRIRCESRDLSESRAAFQLWADLTAAGITIDILVNNAGVGLYGLLDEQDPDDLDRMLQLNMAALTTLTRLVLPGMRQRHWGRILNVASIVAYQPGGPRMTTYYATKAYVLSFSKGLARELDGSGVSVTVLAPGPTETSFDDRAGANLNVLYKQLPKMTAAAVARAGYDGMKRQSMVVIPGLMPKALALAGELPPRRIALEVNRLLWKPRPTQSLPP
jgi:short-subunit dehydrogenase